MLPGAPADYDEWGHGWSHAAIEPCMRRAERQMRVRRTESEALSPWHRAFTAAYGDAAIVHPANAVGTVRWNAAFAYLDPVRERENLSIIADTLVDRVLLDGDRAVGVATAAGELRARRVVLAAGAYGSPAILLRSGVGPERGLPVGEGLIDHVGVGFSYEGTDLLQREVADFERSHPLFMAQVTVALSSSGCDAGASDLFLFPDIDPPGEDGYEVSVAVFAMKPASRGSVSLNSTDPREPPRIEHGFLSDPADAAVIAEGVDSLRRLAAEDPIRLYAGREMRPGPEVDAMTRRLHAFEAWYAELVERAEFQGFSPSHRVFVSGNIVAPRVRRSPLVDLLSTRGSSITFWTWTRTRAAFEVAPFYGKYPAFGSSRTQMKDLLSHLAWEDGAAVDRIPRPIPT